MTVVTAQRPTGRTLVSPELFACLTDGIVEEKGYGPDLAERIVEQALSFLAACAGNTGDPLAPSELVDVGWHALILRTRDYAAFCQRVAGRFIHHVPADGRERAAHGEAARATLVRTVEAIRGLGFAVDEELWSSDNAKCQKCTGCHNGCHDDPPPLLA